MTLQQADGSALDRGVPDRAALVRAAAKPRRFGIWYVAEHRLRGFRAWGAGVFANAVLNPVLTLYAFGIGLGALVSQHAGPQAVDGVSFLAFIAPAMLCAALLQIGAEEGWFTFLSGFKWNFIFYGMRSAPLSGAQIIGGTVIGLGIRLLGTGIVYYVIALCFGVVHLGWSLLMIPIGVLAALCFAMPVAAISCGVEDDRGQHNIIMRVIVMPMTLFSGTMYPLTVLPIWLQWIGWISPLWHASQLSRDVSYGASEPGWLVAIHLVFLVVPAVVGWWFAVRVATRRLQK